MDRRRVVFTLGVVYSTTHEKLQKIPAIIKDIISLQDLTTFDRAHFAKFGSYSLDFEIVYFIESADYLLYMNTQESINLKIVKAFEEEKIEFAYPTQTVIVNK
jgi:small-conductance mechanosensitive channel